MTIFEALYNKVLPVSVEGNIDEVIQQQKKEPDFDAHHLDCLLNPEKHPPVIRIAPCDCQGKECLEVCFFDAVSHDAEGNAVISYDKCVGCNACIEHCPSSALTDIKEALPVFKLLHSNEVPVFALIAPAYISQFSADMTPGKLRSAFKKLGFSGMIEVALFADILTLKEALEFDKSIHEDKDYMLTSCCCPMWIAMIRKVYHLLVPHLPPSVSPMVACGRSIKKLHPGAKTVFVGPCVAKKAEARQPDIEDAVDYVLTFQEIQQIFDIAKIHPAQLEEDLRDHSSKGGRIYARTGGVSQAVQSTLDRLVPDRSIPLKARQANGVRECKEMLNHIMSGEIDANFLEGMGCVGGCVGGPKALIDKEEGRAHVNAYGQQAPTATPVDNPYVLELLARLGFDTIESLLEGDNLFTRDLNAVTK